jgi:hypothetical protein
VREGLRRLPPRALPRVRRRADGLQVAVPYRIGALPRGGIGDALQSRRSRAFPVRGRLACAAARRATSRIRDRGGPCVKGRADRRVRRHPEAEGSPERRASPTGGSFPGAQDDEHSAVSRRDARRATRQPVSCNKLPGGLRRFVAQHRVPFGCRQRETPPFRRADVRYRTCVRRQRPSSRKGKTYE